MTKPSAARKRQLRRALCPYWPSCSCVGQGYLDRRKEFPASCSGKPPTRIQVTGANRVADAMRDAGARMREALDLALKHNLPLGVSHVTVLKPGIYVVGALRGADEYAQPSRGWRTCGCGQWVHPKLAPCSVCKPKRKRKRK